MSAIRFVLVSILAGMWACSGDTTALITAESISIVSRNSQASLPGAELTDPLRVRVRVLGSDGKPFANTPVNWTVTRGQATLNPRSSITDANGETQTRVVLVSSAGLIMVSATARGLTPALFQLNGLDPCITPRDENMETNIMGQLQALDCTSSLVAWPISTASTSLSRPFSISARPLVRRRWMRASSTARGIYRSVGISGP